MQIEPHQSISAATATEWVPIKPGTDGALLLAALPIAVHADPGVTLEEDLVRRDLTINAMALDLISGELIDPHGGQSDLAAGRLQTEGLTLWQTALESFTGWIERTVAEVVEEDPADENHELLQETL